jgi:hypothetical protein
MEEDILEYLEHNEFVKNEHGVYIYKSDNEIHHINLQIILEDFLEFHQKKQKKRGK